MAKLRSLHGLKSENSFGIFSGICLGFSVCVLWFNEIIIIPAKFFSKLSLSPQAESYTYV